MSIFTVRCNLADGGQTMASLLNVNASANDFDAQQVIDEFEGLFAGTRAGYVTVFTNGVQATGTVTISSMVATDTVTINGVVFTCVASGATGNQFNVGGSDTVTATNLAAAVNASTSAKIVNAVRASSATNVVTITAMPAAAIGNLFTLAISAHGSVSGANLTGGTDGTVASRNFGVAIS
jgi:phage tail sheath gpL-like